MTDETADSGAEGGIDMDAAMDEITESIFDKPPPTVEAAESHESKEDEVNAKETEKVEKSAEEKVLKADLPTSWKKEMQDKWDGVDPDTQAYFLQREKQMSEGLEKDRGDANLGRVMRDVMSPYSAMLKEQKIDESVMVKNLMNAHYRITTADDAGKLALIKQFAQSYGISLDGSKQQVDPAMKSLQDRLNGIEYNLTASHEKALTESRERVATDVEQFASDPKHSFFDEVSEQIIPLINAGYTLEDAYENAIWLNPVTRQKEIDRLNKEAAEKSQSDAKAEVDKAKKAKSTNVRASDTSRTPTEPKGTMEDTMRETFREIQNRSH